MNKIFLIILFFSYSVFATSINTLEKRKFVEGLDSYDVSVRTSSDYFSILSLAQQTGIIQDADVDKIVYANFSNNVHELEYYSVSGTKLEGILTITYASPISWQMAWWTSEVLLLESTGDDILLESGYKIVLEKDSI